MGRSGLLEMVLKSISNPNVGLYLFDLVKGVCPFSPTILWDTTRTLYLHVGVIVISHIG